MFSEHIIYRDCQIIDRADRVIVVEASSGDENKGEQPTIQFTPTEDSLVRFCLIEIRSFLIKVCERVTTNILKYVEKTTTLMDYSLKQR